MVFITEGLIIADQLPPIKDADHEPLPWLYNNEFGGIHESTKTVPKPAALPAVHLQRCSLR